MKYKVHVVRYYKEEGEFEIDSDSVRDAECDVERFMKTGNTALFAWGEKELVDSVVDYTEAI